MTGLAGAGVMALGYAIAVVVGLGIAVIAVVLPTDLLIGLLAACLPGGFAGDFACWRVAGRRLAGQWGGAA